VKPEDTAREALRAWREACGALPDVEACEGVHFDAAVDALRFASLPVATVGLDALRGWPVVAVALRTAWGDGPTLRPWEATVPEFVWRAWVTWVEVYGPRGVGGAR